MLPRETASDDRLRTERSGGTGGLLRKSAPLLGAFLVGFLLGRHRNGSDGGQTGGDADRTGGGADRTGGEQAPNLGEIASRIRSRAMPTELDPRETVGADQTTFTESVKRIARGDEAQQQSKRETESRRGETEAAGIDVEVTQLSAPTTRGMPTFGVGTYQDADYDECFESVQQALRMGYRHVDATERREAYYVEEAVGDAIDATRIDREDLFVATKVSPEDLAYDHVLTSAEESLDRLGLDYVDLLYVHWPTGEYDPTDTLDAFAELRQEGLIERIGVSNFTVDLLEEAIEASEEPIFANQVEMHPLLPQEDLREFCAQDDVDVELVAYSPIARGDVENVTALQEVADKHGATAEQVSLAWLREKDVTAIPEATSEAHLRENWRSLALELDAEDVEKIDAIEKRERIVDPEQAPWNR